MEKNQKTLALENIKVLDFTNNIAGPGAAVLMAERGAEVIHIEKPVLGDDSRFFPPLLDGNSFNFMWINRGKKSVVLNLKDPKAIETVYRMIREADVLIESNRPGVMKRLGLDYDTVKKLNERLVYCSISAFGQEGPYAQRAGYDVIAQAFSGIIYRTGAQDGPPTKIGYAIGDYVGSLNAFGSIMMALYQRSVTGKGQQIDVSLARGLTWMNNFFEAPITGFDRKRMGNHDGQLSPYGIFRGPDFSSIVIAAVNATIWEKLCRAMGREDMIDDPRFCTNVVRVKNRSAVTRAIEAWLDDVGNIDEAYRILNEYGVACSKVMTPKEILEDEHVQQSGWITDIPVPDSVTSETGFPGCVGLASFSDAGLLVEAAEDLGASNAEVLTQYGMTIDEVNEYENKWAERR